MFTDEENVILKYAKERCLVSKYGSSAEVMERCIGIVIIMDCLRKKENPNKKTVAPIVCENT